MFHILRCPYFSAMQWSVALRFVFYRGRSERHLWGVLSFNIILVSFCMLFLMVEECQTCILNLNVQLFCRLCESSFYSRGGGCHSLRHFGWTPHQTSPETSPVPRELHRRGAEKSPPIKGGVPLCSLRQDWEKWRRTCPSEVSIDLVKY